MAIFATEADALFYMQTVAVEKSGFSRWLGVQPLKVWQGQSELVLAVRPEMTQHHGYAHGAIVGLMADNACAWAAASLAGDVVTGSYTIHFVAPAKGMMLRAKGQVIKPGRRQVVVRAEVWSESGDGAEAMKPVLCAVATAAIVPLA